MRKRLHQHQIQSLLLLLDKKHLHSLRIRKKSRPWLKVPQPNNFRHHFYRQAAPILGWNEQQVFEEEFIEIVRSTFSERLLPLRRRPCKSGKDVRSHDFQVCIYKNATFECKGRGLLCQACVQMELEEIPVCRSSRLQQDHEPIPVPL